MKSYCECVDIFLPCNQRKVLKIFISPVYFLLILHVLVSMQLVMVILKGPVAISFNGNKEPAAYAEMVSMGGITKQVKRDLIATLGKILEAKLSIPRTRFFLKVYDTTAAGNSSKL